jgi:hypothetical protein
MNKPPHSNTPQGFLRGASLHPGQRAARQVVVPVKQAPVKPALLTTDARGKVYLSLALCETIGFRALPKGVHLELFPPRARNGGVWRLEIRPNALAYPALSVTPGSLPAFRTGSILSPRHFQVRQHPGCLYSRIALELVSPTPDEQGFYILRPNHAFSSQVH